MDELELLLRVSHIANDQYRVNPTHSVEEKAAYQLGLVDVCSRMLFRKLQESGVAVSVETARSLVLATLNCTE